MACRTKALHAISIGKTKLSESDLIVRLLCEDGSRIDVVAKGARKPRNAISSKIEISNELDLLLNIGKGLPIIKECRLVSAGPGCGSSLLTTTSACTIAEFAVKTAQQDLEVLRYFELIKAAFATLQDASEKNCINVVSAYLLKGSSILGMRPALHQCAVCGKENVLSSAVNKISFSYNEGGIICDECALSSNVFDIDLQAISLSAWMIQNPFNEILNLSMSFDDSLRLLEFVENWTSCVFGIKLKSLNVFKSLLIS